PFLARGRSTWEATRAAVVDALTDVSRRDEVEPLLTPVDDLTVLLPVEVADYVDFYCSRQHATNVARVFRPDDPDPLPA
ncbi:hypothetical protein WAI88_23040, partial [Acinetobacter baumannii]